MVCLILAFVFVATKFIYLHREYWLMKKGQVTIFILIFFVLLMGFGFVFYLLNQSASDTTQSSQKAIIDELKARTSLEQQMRECLNVGLKKGLRLVGEQGGFVYKDQVVDETFYGLLDVGPSDGVDLPGEWRVGDVPIYLKRPTYQPSTTAVTAANAAQHYPYSWIAYEPPLYPCMSYRGHPGEGLFTQPLCSQVYDGSSVTSISFPFWEDRDGDVELPIVVKDCSVAGCNRTVQSSVERYAQAYFEKCFEEIQIPGFDLELRGEPGVSAFFSFTTIELGVEPEFTVHGDVDDFSFTFPRVEATPVLFKSESFFTQLSRVMKLEAVSPTFNFTHAFLETGSLPSVQVVSSGIDASTYLVAIRLSGRDANIYGEPFTFQMMFENRVPVLLPIADLDVSDQGNKRVICAADPDAEFRAAQPIPLQFSATKDPLDSYLTFSPVPVPVPGPVGQQCVEYSFFFPSECIGGCSGDITVKVIDGGGLEDFQEFRVQQ